MRKSPASTLGGADNRASNVVGNDEPVLYAARPQLQDLAISEVPKNSHETFRLVRRFGPAGEYLEIQLARRNGCGSFVAQKRFAFGARHLPKLRALLAAREGEAS